MAENRQKLIHLHSGVEGKAPSKEILNFGEIAVNHWSADTASLYVKAGEGENEEVVRFINEKEITRLIEKMAGEQVAELSGVVETFSAATVAEFEDVKADLAELSGETMAFSAATVEEFENVKDAMDAMSAWTTAHTVADLHYTPRSDGKNATLQIEFLDGTLSEGIDASDFVIDGMLSSVTYDTSAHTMTFEWNTDAGIKEVTVDFDELTAPYAADEKTIHLERGAEGAGKFSAIVDKEDGLVSFNNFAQFSAETLEMMEEADEALAKDIEELAEAAEASATTLDAKINELSAATMEMDEALADAIEELEAAAEASATTLDAKIEELSAATMDALEELKADSLENIVVNGVSGDVVDNIASVVLDSEDILLGRAIEISGQSIADVEDTITDAIEKVAGVVLENELVVAAALNDLDTRVDALENAKLDESLSASYKLGQEDVDAVVTTDEDGKTSIDFGYISIDCGEY